MKLNLNIKQITNQRSMNHRQLAQVIGLFIVSSLTAQIQDDLTQGILSNINTSRQAHSLASLEYDSILSVSCNEIEEEFAKKQNLKDDYIRSVLRSNGNFDYNINLIEIESRNIEKTLDKTLESINANLKDILNNPRINKIGVMSKEVGRKERVLLLFSENYIEFDKYFIHEFHDTPDGGRRFIIIPGKSKIEGITYKLSGQELDKTKPILLSHEREFRLKIELTNLSEDAPRLIEFKNPEGRIVSIVNY